MARFIAERKVLFAGNLGLRLIKDLLPFVGPILIGIVVDLLSGSSGRNRSLLGIDLQQNSVRAIVIVAIFMAALAVAKAVVGYIHTIVAAHMGRHVVQAARRDLADAAMKMSLDERRRFNSGDLLDRCLADSKGLRSFTQNVIIRVISNTVRAVFPLAFMFMIDPLLAIVVLAVIPLQSTFSAILQRRLQRQTHEARSRESLHTSAVKEAIDGWNNVASVGGQEWAAKGIHATAAASEDAKIVKKHTTASISVVISLCTAMGIAAVYAIGGWRIISSGVLDGTADADALTLGTLTAFVGVAKKTYAPFQAYTKIVSSYRTGLVNLERIADVLDAPMIAPRADGPDLKVTEGNIGLEMVSFSYEDDEAPTLHGLTGQIPGHALTVITGSSGAGKTTLLRLLLGLDVPSTGVISIDGQDINEAKLASVQQAIALVPQEPVLFTGTMSENLLLGLEDITTAQLLEACDRAGLVEMVRALPDGLETKVGSGKHMLSGGQLRRVAIARALLRDPAVLLLDEPTTGLDVQNSSLILNTLRRISDRTTVVMVSHRSEPLLASDHHLILQDGNWAPASSDRKSRPSRALGGAIPFPSWNGPQHKPAGSNGSPANGSSPNGIAANGSTTNGTADEQSTEGVTNQASTRSPKPFNSLPSYLAQPSDPGNLPTNGGPTSTTGSPGKSTSNVTPIRKGVSNEPAPPEPVGEVDQRVLALSAMGRPIVLTSATNDAATTRVLMISGHRAKARPITALAPAIFAQIAADEAPVALACIEDVNPDGSFSELRQTALGVDIETDHVAREAAETSILRRTIDQWKADIVIDVAEGTRQPIGTQQVTVVIRFLPDASGQPTPELMRFAQHLKYQLTESLYRFDVKFVGAARDTLAATHDATVVELTASDPRDPSVVRALIAAAVAVYRTAAGNLQPS